MWEVKLTCGHKLTMFTQPHAEDAVACFECEPGNGIQRIIKGEHLVMHQAKCEVCGWARKGSAMERLLQFVNGHLRHYPTHHVEVRDSHGRSAHHCSITKVLDF